MSMTLDLPPEQGVRIDPEITDGVDLDAEARGWRPPSWLVDVAAVFALGLMAVLSFVASFGLIAFAVGSLSLLVGVAVSMFARARGWRSWTLLLLGIAVLVVIGPVLVVPSLCLGGFIPTPQAVWALLSGLVTGWQDALASVTPIGRLDALLVLPFAGGLVAGLLGCWLARSSTRWWLATPAPALAVLLAGIAESTSSPSLTGLRGAVFAAIGIVWLAYRQRRERAVSVIAVRDRVRRRRLLLLLLLALVVGWGVGSTPFVSNSESRVVPRDHVVIPISPQFSVSALSEYRLFRVTDAGQILFQVSGKTDGLPLRIAIMDHWDGSTWQSGASDIGPAGVFERVSGSLANQGGGGALRGVTVTVAGPWHGQVWVPQIGVPRAIAFHGPDASGALTGLRLNLSSGTMAVQGGLIAGTVLAQATPSPYAPTDPPQSTTAIDAGLVAPLPRLLATSACQPHREQVAELNCLADFLKGHGVLSHGQNHQPVSLAGASASRLTSIAAALGGATGSTSGMQPSSAGDAEQYASLLALAGTQIGVPSRVVVGVRSVTDGPIRGKQITAWAEVWTGSMWKMLADPVPTNTQSPPQQQNNTTVAPVPIIPPSHSLPPLGYRSSGSSCKPGSHKAGCTSSPSASSTFEIPAWVGPVVGIPLAVVAALLAVTLGLMGLKIQRRRRRRSAGTPSMRISAGWRELTDVMRDTGRILPTSSTRRETAVLLGVHGITRAAKTGDTLLFGPGEPNDGQAETYWSDVDATSAAVLASLRPFDRWKAHVNVTSFGIGEWVDAGAAWIRARAVHLWGIVREKVGGFGQ